jgi:hypothetical protein
MNIKTIVSLIETHTLEELEKAEQDLLEGLTPQIVIDGKDEGEQLTHAMAAIWCKTEMQIQSVDSRTAVRLYTQKVRNSIS